MICTIQPIKNTFADKNYRAGTNLIVTNYCSPFTNAKPKQLLLISEAFALTVIKLAIISYTQLWNYNPQRLHQTYCGVKLFTKIGDESKQPV